MPSSNQLISSLAAVGIASVNAAFGPAFSTGPVADGSFIRESTSTLVLPSAPSNNNGDASLWVGMGTSNGDLIQSIAENWQSSTWDIYAYTLLSTGRMLRCTKLSQAVSILTGATVSHFADARVRPRLVHGQCERSDHDAL